MTDQLTLKRNTRVHVQVTPIPPYTVIDRQTKVQLSSTLDGGEGIYLTNVNFKVIDGQPTVEGTYKGRIERTRVNISDGRAIMFDPTKGAFTDGEQAIKSARMVQLYNGIINVVIESE